MNLTPCATMEAMPTLSTRAEPELGMDDVVLRGGQLSWDAALVSVETCFRRFGVHGLSVCAGSGSAVDDLYRSPYLQKYPEARLAIVQDVARLGLRLIPTSNKPHYTLDLGRPLDEELWETLRTVFGTVVYRP